MTLDQLIELNTDPIDKHFGEALAEQIVECSDPTTLLALSAFLDFRIRKLIDINPPEISEDLVERFF